MTTRAEADKMMTSHESEDVRFWAKQVYIATRLRKSDWGRNLAQAGLDASLLVYEKEKVK